jgi:hypothetical protein
MMKRVTFLAILLYALGSGLDLQGQGALGINSTGASPDPKSVLDMVSSNQGFLIPRMTKAQRNLIASPAEGLMVYQSDVEKGFYSFDGTTWRPFRKSVGGRVSMGLVSSTVDRGGGFTVSHSAEGRDQITYIEPITVVPDITLTGEGLPGIAPSTPFDYCHSVLSQCSNVYINYLRLRNGSAAGPLIFDTGSSIFCNAATDNYMFYKIGDPQYLLAPNFSPSNTVFLQTLRSHTATPANTNAFSIWFDWDQSGDFENINSFGNNELIVAETGGLTTTASSPYSYAIVVPSGANVCNGVITGRLMVRDVQNHQIPCITATRGETEDFEINVSGGTNCSLNYPARPVNCNIIAPNFTGFRVNCVDRFGDPINGRYNFKVIE